MIRSFNKMHGLHIKALDGEIGKLKDVYFDDRSWGVEYFVIELGSWFTGYDVLVPPSIISYFDGTLLNVQLTKAELKTCPHADSAIPVSLQPRYRAKNLLSMTYSYGNFTYGGPMMVPPIIENSQNVLNDPHLRSCKNVSHYALVCQDGSVGSNIDMLIDDSLWIIRFIVANLNSVSKHRNILYGPPIIEDIDWALASVKVALPRNKVLCKPEIDISRYIDTSYEVLLREMYNFKDEDINDI